MSAGTGIGRTYLSFKERSSAPSTPGATYHRLYFKSSGLYYVNSSGTEIFIGSVLSMTTATDPASNAACTTAIVNTYSGTVITTTGAGNSQTIGSPTATTAGKVFTVVNNDTSTHSIPIVANSVTYTITPGEAQSFIWDGSAWGPVDIGITAIPVVVAQGGTGAATLTDHGVLVGSGTDPVTPLAVGADGTILAGASGADPAFTATPTGLTSIGVGTLTTDKLVTTDNIVDTTLSGTPKIFLIYDGATPYYFKAYPTKP